ncbi:MAG: hypothetical protein AB7L66_11425 [Gemmatimonadales bacterium]
MATPLERARDSVLVRWRASGLAIQSAVANLQHAKADERFLVVHHHTNPFPYDLLFAWLEVFFPEVRARFELRPLGAAVRDWSRYRLHVPWLQDPVQAWSARAYRRALRLNDECRARGIPVVNPVDQLANAGKAAGAAHIASVGFRTPRVVPVGDWARFRRDRAGLAFPFLLREDWGHGAITVRVDNEADLAAVRVESFRRPVASEFVDVVSPDGLFRKYRYVVAGDLGVRQSVHVASRWEVRGTPDRAVYSEAIRDEEIAFTSSPEPEHERFQAARRALGVDFAAFDYSHDQEGRLVVWEANPLPSIRLSGGRRRYRTVPTCRVLIAMVRLYYERAGLEPPPNLDDALTGFSERPAG